MPHTRPAPDTVCILLALHNGAKNLEAQLDSYSSQSHAAWSLIVSDDGSTDAGPNIVRGFAKQHPNRDIRQVEGPGKGFAANFLSLLRAVDPQVPFAALSDQDDVWLENKLKRAVSALLALPGDRPALYCSRTYICDDTLHSNGMSPLFKKPPGFENALVQNIAGGNTMVVNRVGLDLLQAASPLAAGAVCHDWWMYQMITGAGGTVIYDAKPSLKYRQHEDNLIGANNTTRASLSRLKAMMQGTFADWNSRNIATLRACDAFLTPKNRSLLERFARGRSQNPWGRVQTIRTSGIYRQTTRGHTALLMAALLGKI